jgi:putative ABC transport system ATP-binding protein
MSILQAKQVEKNFTEGRETVSVLKGIDFATGRGEIVALEGPSGSGKTTFLSILGCILTPSSGEVVVDGVRVNGRARSLAEVRKRSLGFVFQQFNLFPALTAIENVEYALNVKGLDGHEARGARRGRAGDRGRRPLRPEGFSSARLERRTEAARGDRPCPGRKRSHSSR